MRAVPRCLTAAALLLALGCGDGGTEPSGAHVRVRNLASRPITQLYYSACSASTWGNDRLGGGGAIALGAEHVAPISPGCWDVLAIGTSAGVADVEYVTQGRQVARGDTLTFDARDPQDP